jgi:dUTP pyrophosphatase
MGFFQNEDRVPYTINPGDRVAQMVVERRLDVNIITVDELSDTDRGDRGFGSTGKN